jgi:hypothetical protein
MRPLAAGKSRGLWDRTVVTIPARSRGCEARTIGTARRDAVNGRRRDHEGRGDPGLTTATDGESRPSPAQHKLLGAVILPSRSRSSVPRCGSAGTRRRRWRLLRMTREQIFSHRDVPGRSVIEHGRSARRWPPRMENRRPSRTPCSPRPRGWTTIVRLTSSTPRRATGRMRTAMG